MCYDKMVPYFLINIFSSFFPARTLLISKHSEQVKFMKVKKIRWIDNSGTDQRAASGKKGVKRMQVQEDLIGSY